MHRAAPIFFTSLLALAGCPLQADFFDGGDGGGRSAACGDGQQNQDETDVDCGGVCGASCGYGERCAGDRDCAAGLCSGGICTPPGSTCFDHARDGVETDVDCGGGCPKCADGKRCSTGEDCVSGRCAAGACEPGMPPFVFAPPRFIDVRAQGPSALVARDFDRDGRLDVAVAGTIGRELAVVRGYGDGTFQDPWRLPLPFAPEAIESADLDGDGDPDLVLSFPRDGYVMALLDEAGVLRALDPITVCAGPRHLAIADVDGDGRRDLLVGCQSSGDLALLPGRGDGTFEPAAPLHLGGGVGFVTTGDFDGDGRLDVATLVDYRLLVLRGEGAGTFAMPVPADTVEYPWFLLAADLQPDGKLDLVASSYQGFAAVSLGDGAGGFVAPHAYNLGGAPETLAAADFDGDGKPDLAVANQGPDTIQILRGRGNGAFDTAINFYVGGTLQGIAVGDFDNDGRPDVAMCDWWTHDVGVMLNRSGH